MAYKDLFSSKKTLETAAGKVSYFDVGELEKQGLGNISKLPFSIKILLESVLRNAGTYGVSEEDVKNLAAWKPEPGEISIPLKLARVVLQDFTGVPAVVDLAAMRSATGAMTSRRLIARKPSVATSTKNRLCARRRKIERFSLTR